MGGVGGVRDVVVEPDPLQDMVIMTVRQHSAIAKIAPFANVGRVHMGTSLHILESDPCPLLCPGVYGIANVSGGLAG